MTWVETVSRRCVLTERVKDFDVVFSVVVMSSVSGLELARAIRVRWPDQQVVLTSGKSHILVASRSWAAALDRSPAHLIEDLGRRPYAGKAAEAAGV